MSDLPLLAALRESARAHAARPAVRGDDGTRLSYAQLLERIDALAAALRAAGCEPDETVLVRVSNHPLDFAAFAAVWAAGAVAVPVHRTAPDGSIAAIQQKARARLALDALAATPGQHTPAAAAPHAPADGAPARRDMLRDAALVIFTSGSTGLPKGVVLSHRAFAGKLAENQRLFGFTPDDTALLVLNDTFSFGIWFALVALNHGAGLVTRSRFDAAGFLATLAEERITRVGVVPTMIRATFAALDAGALADARARLLAVGALRDMVIGGEPLGEELSARLRALIAPARLWDVYGLTETSTSDFVLRPEDYAAHPGSIGRPAAGVRHRIVDEQGAECAPGAPGELQLATPFVMNGYLDDEAITREAFAGEWFRTGDLASHDGGGFVSIVGRLKDVVVRGGNKVTPPEIERALCACPGVAAALVAGLPDPVLGQRIHALLVPAQGEALDAAAIRAALADRLERFKQPDACWVAADLPTGRTGKIDRGRLRAMIEAGELAPLPSWTRQA
ncbi:fatty acid--CoA ligase family protein [Burkholderiaceae bacterium FT117]|uniref:class I adenylate-forming enzyme family protein n=1 Tax=Zeimonas sediminis TaxID=2944268 RepID=UPI002342C4A9|nr:fatty acid--CoA ligase family protein [Zeimonas sediminis]MCM5571247.1 fatty acid--CoA ligase family protein [Zeimonas sediminis]